MHTLQNVSERLQAYIREIRELNSRWTKLLNQCEEYSFRLDIKLLSLWQQQVESLLAEASHLITVREQLIVDASSLLGNVTTLQHLAKLLPDWNSSAGQRAILQVKAHLENLRRLHMSCWVLISSQLQNYRDMMSLMTIGTTRRDVYTSSSNSLSHSGGQLLDANL